MASSAESSPDVAASRTVTMIPQVDIPVTQPGTPSVDRPKSFTQINDFVK
jgi:hypothetical protein